MQISKRVDAGTRSWAVFLAAALAICMAFGMLGITSGDAYGAPDDSKSSSAATASSSSSADSKTSIEDVDIKSDIDPNDLSASDELDPTKGMALGDDLLIANDQVSVDGNSVVANIFAAGSQVELKDVTVGADAFVAGETLNVSGLAAKNNIFAAGNNITISGSQGQTVFVSGNNLDIAVDATDAYAAGRTVFLKGTFEGDVHVAGQTVVIDPYIVVKGNLDVSAESEPTIASTAKIGKYEFTQSEFDEGFNVSSGFAEIGSAEWVQNLIMTLLSMLLVGIIMLLCLRTETVNATGKLVRNRPVAILITGLLSLILIPVLAIAFFISLVGWPIGTVLLVICLCATVLCVTYTAIALGRAALPRVNKWITSILFIAIIGVLMSLPIVDLIIAVLCLVFTIGSFVQGWWVWRRGKDIDGDDVYVEDANDVITVPRGNHVDQDAAQAPVTHPLTPSGIPQTPNETVWPD